MPSGSQKRRASAVLHVSPDCLEDLRKMAAKEGVSMGEMVEVLIAERKRRESR